VHVILKFHLNVAMNIEMQMKVSHFFCEFTDVVF